MKKYLKEVLKRKDLLFYLVKSGLKAEHRNSYLGYLWWLLDPLLNAVVYYFLIVVVLGHGGENFGLFLIIGLVAWRWTSSTVNSSTRSIISFSAIISQVYLPKSIFPMTRTLSQLINFMFGLIVIGLFLLFFNVAPSWQVVFLPFIVLAQLLLMMSISFVLAYICVFIRDIDNIMTHITRLWFYATPIIWEGSRLPAKYQWVTAANPLAHIVQAYRDVLMYKTQPNLFALLLIILLSSLFCMSALWFYSRNEHKIIKAL